MRVFKALAFEPGGYMTESLLPLIERGGIIRGVKGSTPQEAIEDLIAKIRLPGHLNSAALVKAVLEREDLQPTSAGHGIALPHPRNPVVTAEDEQFIAIGFTEQPLNWQALDGQDVRAIILIVSSGARSHLHTLSKLHFLCSLRSFWDLLHGDAPAENIKRYVAEAEKNWEK
jgi:PTS system nitrogen regulatory IIA component